MSESSLVPETQLVFSPGLAATIGLEEAILLQQVHGLMQQREPRHRGGYAWLDIDRAALQRLLPFWDHSDLHRILRSLVDKGVLLIDPTAQRSPEQLSLALNEVLAQPPAQPLNDPLAAPRSAPPPPMTGHAGPATPPPRRSASRLPASWAPSEDLLQLLALNHNIPRQFALDQLEDFICYWRERGETNHAWENKFRQHVTSAWRRQQQHQAEAFRSPDPVALDRDWRPSEDALEIMTRGGVERGFIEEAIPEFILYWRERGGAPKELNTKFIQHIRVQWARYTSSVTHSTEPSRIAENWQPDSDVFDILRMSHIDEAFARSLLPEFIIYWRDSNQAHTSWNSKFLQHVKYHWARQHQMQQAGQHHDGPQAGSHSTGRTRDRSLADDLSDTSWAN